VEAVKLNKAQIRDLHRFLGREPLENYELLWVLESCLETPASAVYGLGVVPWSAGLMIVHRNCVWLRLDNEMLLTALLVQLPEQDIYRFYTTSASTLDMLQRWFPQGQQTESRLYVRNLTKTWRKRFDVEVNIEPDPATLGGQICTFMAGGEPVATCAIQEVVLPWKEVVQWVMAKDQDLLYWIEQVFGALTSILLGQGSPVVVRTDSEAVLGILEDLGYREFSKLYYYVAAREE